MPHARLHSMHSHSLLILTSELSLLTKNHQCELRDALARWFFGVEFLQIKHGREISIMNPLSWFMMATSRV